MQHLPWPLPARISLWSRACSTTDVQLIPHRPIHAQIPAPNDSTRPSLAMAASQREDPRGLDDLDTPHTPPMRPPPSYASLTAALEPAPSQGYGSLASEANEHQFMHLGLPSGVFLIRSKAAGQRTLDVRAQGTAEGTEVSARSIAGRSLGAEFPTRCVRSACIASSSR